MSALQMAAATLLLCINLRVQAGVPFRDSITDAAFQTVTIITTTGFATVDFALWPTFCRMALVMLMFTGACAGSTSGGIKISRVAILCKSLKRELKRLAHPHHVSVRKVDGQAVEERVVSSAGAFIAAYLLVLLAGLTVKVGRMLRVKNRFWYFLIGLSWLFTYPYLRMSALLAQPDWFGLIFAFSILLLTLDFRFERLDPLRFVLLFAATAAVILSRRWYLYFVVGYYFSYAVLVLVSSFKTGKAGQKRKALLQVRNLVLFGLLSLAAMVILLWPMVSRILHYSYADRYAYYNGGGLAWEL